MAEVHIVDIDGEQWDIKDLPLTERVTNLETSVNTNIPNRFARDEKKIDGIYTIAHGNSIQECCNKLGYEYDQYGIAYAIAAVFNNPGHIQQEYIVFQLVAQLSCLWCKL